MTLPDGTVVDTDEGVRGGGTVAKLARLKVVFRPDGGVITAGNSSQFSDGSAALLMTTSAKAAELGADPDRAGPHGGPRRRRPGDHADRADPATQKAIKRSGLTPDQIGAYEVNEAFALL